MKELIAKNFYMKKVRNYCQLARSTARGVLNWTTSYNFY